MADLTRAQTAKILASLEELLGDRLVRHAVFLEQFKNGEVRRALSYFNEEVFPEVISLLDRRIHRILVRGYDVNPARTKRVQEMLSELNDLINTKFSEHYQILSAALDDFARQESGTIPSILSRASGGIFSFSRPGLSRISAAVRSRPFEGRFLRDWYNKLSSDTQSSLRRVVYIGIQEGKKPEEIVRAFRGTSTQNFRNGMLKRTRFDIETMVRTAVTHVSNYAREEAFAANDNLIESVIYTAVLDSRTTIICANLDGREFPVGEGPRPPMHPRCRSTTRPKLKSVPGFTDRLPESTRAALGGPVSDRLTYQEWLRRQPTWVQNRVLGRTRAKAFRGGESLNRFVNRNNQVLTLKELDLLDGID